TETSLAAAAAEKCFKEIAETRSAEFEFHATVAGSITLESSPSSPPVPAWRRLKSTRLIPIRAQLVVLLPLLRIAQDFLCLVDLLEFLLGGRFVLRHIRMIFAREFPEGAPDLVVARTLRNTQRLVIVSELHSHAPPSFCAAADLRNYEHVYEKIA